MNLIWESSSSFWPRRTVRGLSPSPVTLPVNDPSIAPSLVKDTSVTLRALRRLSSSVRISSMLRQLGTTGRGGTGGGEPKTMGLAELVTPRASTGRGGGVGGLPPPPEENTMGPGGRSDGGGGIGDGDGSE